MRVSVYLCSLTLLTGHALAQPTDAPATPPAPLVGPQPPKFPTRTITEEEADVEKARLEKEITAAFSRNEFGIAEEKLRELIPLDHENFVPWYNLACALSVQDKTDEAMKMLQQSIARGFADLRQLQTDPHLAKLRKMPAYRNLIGAWSEIAEKRTEKTIADARKKFHVGEKGSKYAQEKDETLRLIYISAFDPMLFGQAKEDAAKLARWWRELAGPEADARNPTNNKPGNDKHNPPGDAPEPLNLTPWVLVILPNRADYINWAASRFGDRFDRVGGEYNHDAKMLVSMDLGSSWRHEFWHVLHWRDMDTRGQRHPMWVMEGLCSLVEDCEADAKGAMVPKPSWRTNMVRRLARNGNLIPFDLFFGSGRKTFMGDRTLAFYGQGRAMFLYLFERGHLRDWYQTYTRMYAEDSTGKLAFETVKGMPIKDVEKDFKQWARNLPEVPEEVGRGKANLPFDVGQGLGEGPIVEIDAIAEFTQPGAKPVNSGGLRDKDVITTIDGKPVRDLNDLARVLGGYEAGATVSVSYLRGKQHGDARLKLVPPR